MDFCITTCESRVVATFVNLTLNTIITDNGSYDIYFGIFKSSLGLQAFIGTCRYIPLQERSRAVAVVFGGLSFGSVLGYVY
jgi:hypothetical protein